MGLIAVALDSPTGVGIVFSAGWDGECSSCHEPFGAGDDARYIDGVLVGFDCGCGNPVEWDR